MISRDQVADWSENYRQAWVNADDQLAASLFTEDATYRGDIYNEPHRGRAGIAAYWADVTSAQSDVTVRMGLPRVSGSSVMVEFWTNMTVGGAPTTLAGCLLLDFDDNGLCTALREYWNFTEGRKDPPQGWGS